MIQVEANMMEAMEATDTLHVGTRVSYGSTHVGDCYITVTVLCS